MRSTILLCTCLSLAACGGGSSSATIPAPTVPISVDSSTSVPVTTAPPATTSPSSRPSNSTSDQPGAAPEPGSANFGVRLDIEQALLPDAAFSSPWEPQFRETDRTGYGAGPNQTDCAPYWALEEMRGAGGGHAMWWVDGGNANHYVARVPDPDDVSALFEIASIPKMCPTVRWNEGGAFTTESIPLDDGIGLRFTDTGSGEITWFAVVTFGDLASVLDVPLWTNVDGERVAFGRDDLNRLATQMDDLLRTAGPADPNIAPSTTAPVTTTPNASTTTIPTRPTDAPVTGLGKLLLGPADLPAGYGAPRVRAHTSTGPDDDLVEICPAAASIDQIDALLEWSAGFSTDDNVELEQIIGRAPSATDASDVVELFAEVVDCDLSKSFGADIESSGGMISIDGADAAASLLLTATDESFVGELIVMSVDDVVVIVSVAFDEGALLEDSLAESIAALAVAKIRDGLQ